MTTEGQLLSDLQRKGILFDQAIDLARQIASTLAAAHAVSVMHGALDATKIRVDGDRVTLIDFDPAHPGLRPGADRAGDVLALGRVLYEMLCLQPYDGKTPVSAVRANVSPQLDTLVTAMLATQPEARPAMAAVAVQLGTVSSMPATSPAEVSHQQLQADLERYIAAKEWPKAVETIQQFIERESDPMRRAAYCNAAAVIYRDELALKDEALELCDFALDNYFMNADAVTDDLLPLAMRPFEMIERVLTEQRDWKTLERAHRKMIRRVTVDRFRQLQAKLFDKLGEIYRSRLDHASAALAAFEMAQQLDPANEVRTEGIDRAALLAELRASA